MSPVSPSRTRRHPTVGCWRCLGAPSGLAGAHHPDIGERRSSAFTPSCRTTTGSPSRSPGAYTVDWGDRTTENFAAGVTAYAQPRPWSSYDTSA